MGGGGGVVVEVWVLVEDSIALHLNTIIPFDNI